MNIVETMNEVNGFLRKLPVEDLKFIMLLHDKWFPMDDDDIKNLRKRVDENDKSSIIHWLMGTDPIAENGGFLDFINSLEQL